MFKDADILQDEHFQQLIQNRNLKHNSIRIYKNSLKNYSNFTGLTPTELIEEAEEEEDQGIRKKNRKIKKHLIGFIQHLKDNKKAPNTINNQVVNIKSFYREYEIELPNIKCNIKPDQELLTIKDLPTKVDIKKLLKYANLKYKAIILLMMSSGMGSAEIRNLSLRDYIDAHGIAINEPFNIQEVIRNLQENEKNVPTWSIKRVKTGMPYFTFSSPESNKAINEYLEDRLLKHPIDSLEDFLFSSVDHQISSDTFNMYFNRLNATAGLGKYKKQSLGRSHNLRKYFASTIKNHGFDTVDAEWLIGHKVRSITDVYIKPDIYRLKKDYLDVLTYLSIEEIETKTILSPEFKELKQKYEEDSKAKEDEIHDLREEMGLVKGILEGILKEEKNSE